MGPKYEFTGETKKWGNSTVHRIRRLSDGKLGGWIESEDNLSQEGNCWVADNAKVYDNAKVSGNAKVYDDACVCGKAQVYDYAQVYRYAYVYGNARVYGNAQICDNARVFERAIVFGNACVYVWAKVADNAQVYGNAKVFDNACVYGNAKVYDNAKVYGEAYMCDNAKVYGEAQVYDDAKVFDNASVYGNAKVYGKAKVCSKAKVYDNVEIYNYAEILGHAEVFGSAKIFGKAKIAKSCISTGEYNDALLNEEAKVIKDFIYKIDASSKLLYIQDNYDTVEAFFEDVNDDSYVEHECLTISTLDTEIPILKIEKVQVKNKSIFKFIVDIINEDGDDYRIRFIIDSKDKFEPLLHSIIESLYNYPQYSKYAEDLENCI